MFFKHVTKTRFIVLYVDDFRIKAFIITKIMEVHNSLSVYFELKSLGEAADFLSF